MKIERAKQHIDDLNRAVTEYLTQRPFELRIRQTCNPNRRTVYTEVKVTIPEGFSLVLGDAVHNLRSAIDQLCWGMVGNRAKNPRGVGFPFADREDALRDAIAKKQMDIAPKTVIDEFYKLQPYPDGNKFLHAVNSLDVTDKHRNILLVYQGVKLTGAQMRELIYPREPNFSDNSLLSTVGDWEVQLDGTEPIEVFDRKADYQPTFTIGFGQEEALESLPLDFALENMVTATDKAVRGLARAFFN